MASMQDSLPDHWPKHARVMCEAGRRLQSHYGDKPVSVADIQQEINHIGGYARDSLRPSDYCYNLLNKAGVSGTCPVFVRVERGFYRYVGPHFAYTGPVYWKPKDGPERQVGECVAGECTLFEDPREQTKRSSST